MLENLFVKVFPMIVSGLGFLCFKYPIPMRRLLFYFTFSLISITVLVSCFFGGVLYMYNEATTEMDSAKMSKKFPCDSATIKFSQQYDQGIDFSKVILIEHLIIVEANFQEGINSALIAFYTAIGLLIVTYISTYISKYKLKKLAKNSNNHSPPTPT